jgi:hypothetical protein
MTKKADLVLATAWELTDFLVDPGMEMQVGPIGEHKVELRLWSPKHDATQVAMTHMRSHEVFAKGVWPSTRRAAELLEELHDLVTPVADERAISRIHPPRQAGSSGEPAGQQLHPRLLEIADAVPLKDLTKTVEDVARKEAIRLLKLLRWRMACDDDFSLRSSSGVYWQSQKDEKWRRIPSRPGPPTGVRLRIGVSTFPAIVQDISDRLAKDAQPPLSFDLLFEARKLASSHFRLSLVEAVQAIELATKDAICRLCPSARWLAFEIPMPPVAKLLEEYLPSLIAEPEVSRQFKAFIKAKAADIKKVVLQRNEITHKGLAVDRDRAQFACDLASEVLYQLEYVCGENWAASAKLVPG